MPPVFGLVKFIDAVKTLLHNVWLAIAFTVAVGNTVMLKVMGVPAQVTPL